MGTVIGPPGEAIESRIYELDDSSYHLPSIVVPSRPARVELTYSFSKCRHPPLASAALALALGRCDWILQ